MSSDKIQIIAALPGLVAQTEAGPVRVEAWLLSAEAGFRPLALVGGALRPVGLPVVLSPSVPTEVGLAVEVGSRAWLLETLAGFGTAGVTVSDLKSSVPARQRSAVGPLLLALEKSGEVVWAAAQGGRRYWVAEHSPEARARAQALADVLDYVRDFGGESVPVTSLHRDLPGCNAVLAEALRRGVLVAVEGEADMGQCVLEPER